MRPPSRPVVRRSADGIHPIAALPPLKLNAADVERVGVPRAALNAVRDDARVDEIKAAARSESQEAYEAAIAASANLARRTATAYARSVAAFVKPGDDKPPF
ncbi:hypothetical protein [uncultured Arthrobacter sp.]|uniref:hypothetical protein n=1 Tax=uncultured Arthrobacter sp. TaxID=114050 RepID=UPI00321659BF